MRACSPVRWDRRPDMPAHVHPEPPVENPGRIAVRAGKLFDGTGTTLIDDAVVIVSGRRIEAAGARLALGTDTTGGAGMPHGHENAVEFRLMAETMEPADALLSGTRVAAQALGLDAEVGTVQPGACADPVAVRENPLRDLDTLQRVEFVMQSGRVVVSP